MFVSNYCTVHSFKKEPMSTTLNTHINRTLSFWIQRWVKLSLEFLVLRCAYFFSVFHYLLFTKVHAIWKTLRYTVFSIYFGRKNYTTIDGICPRYHAVQCLKYPSAFHMCESIALLVTTLHSVWNIWIWLQIARGQYNVFAH